MEAEQVTPPPASVQAYLEGDRFAAGVGIRLLEARAGYAKASLAVTPEHLNAGGRTQSGNPGSGCSNRSSSASSTGVHFTPAGGGWANSSNRE